MRLLRTLVALAITVSSPAFASELTCVMVSPASGVVGQELHFDTTGTDLADEIVTVYSWNFGDGTLPLRTPTASSIDYSFATEGTYEVELTISTQSGASCTTSAQVVIGDASPSVNPRVLGSVAPVEGNAVVMTAGASAGAVSEPITGYEWDFGDGSEKSIGARLNSISHIYNKDGDYEVCVTVSDADSSTKGCFTLSVADLQPNAVFSADSYFVTEGTTVSFDASLSRAGGEIDPITKYEWDFGDGSEIVSSTSPIVEHVYTTAGTFEVKLAVFDTDSSTVATTTMTVFDVSPTASFRIASGLDSSNRATEGELVSLDASASRPGNEVDPIVKYEWDFGDDTTESSDSPLITHAWQDNGNYIITLRVFDEDGSVSSTTSQISVQNRDPVVSLNVSLPMVDGIAQAEQAIAATFTLEVDDAEGDLPPYITWNMGDGTTYLNQTTVTHAFNGRGEFLVEATVQDGDGGTAGVSMPVAVVAGAPSFGPFEDQAARENVPFALNLTASPVVLQGALDGPLTLVVDSLPAGMELTQSTSSENSTLNLALRWTPTYADAGRHNVALRVIAPSGRSRSVSFAIDVAEEGTAYVAALAGNNNRGVLSFYPIERSGNSLYLGASKTLEIGMGTADLLVANDFVFAAAPGSGSVAVAISTENGYDVVRHIPTGAGASSLAADASRLFVGNHFARTVSVVDMNSLKVTQTIQVPEAPVAVAVFNGKLLVASKRTLSIYDASDFSAVNSIALTEAPSRFVTKGSAIYMLAERSVQRLSSADFSTMERFDLQHAPIDVHVNGSNLVLIDGAHRLTCNNTIASEAFEAELLAPLSAAAGGGEIIFDGESLIMTRATGTSTSTVANHLHRVIEVPAITR